MICEYEDKFFPWQNLDFVPSAFDVFRFQYNNNRLYKRYCDFLGVNPGSITQLNQLPFLPISFFKSHKVVTSDFIPEAQFESSGTTGSINSKHLVRSIDLYQKSFLDAFSMFYGDLSDWCIIGLLPSYLERQNSSLVVMVNELIRRTAHPLSGFYLNDMEGLYRALQKLEQSAQKTLLIGVTFALLDFAERYSLPLRNTVLMETGGMKGRGKELTRDEVHQRLRRSFEINQVHAEYGMTELLSQAYSAGSGIFNTPPWMKILIREEDDPFAVADADELGHLSRNGLINVIDLANIYSCSFIATDDVGKLYPDGSFEVLGRRDSSDLRGCSLMVSG